MKQLYTLCFSILLILQISGCTSDKPSHIEVNGEATVKAPVDFLRMQVDVSERSPQKDQVEQKGYEAARQVQMYLLDELGLPDSLINTEQSSLNEFYNRSDDQTWYEFHQTYTVRLDSVQLFETVRQELVHSGASEVRLLNMGSSRISTFQEEAYKKAFRTAHKQAQLLADQAGLTLSKATTINSSYQQYPSPMLRSNRVVMEESMTSRPTTLIQSDIEVQAQIQVTFAAY